MFSFNLAKKLLPAKMAWKSFTNTLHLKLNEGKISQAITKTRRQVVASLPIGDHPLLPRKLRALTHLFSTCRHHIHDHHHHHHQIQNSCDAIFVDDLFPHPPSWQASKANVMAASSGSGNMPSRGSGNGNMPSRGSGNMANAKAQEVAKPGVKVFDVEKASPSNRNSVETNTSDDHVAEEWEVTSLPQTRGIDGRAEEFISNFYRELKLERELERVQYMLDFEDMLARGA
ncbi:unnamed protein product [Ilex paraguariensis]|uniref:Uncharacterized protein n=1 Tax=Ilex paraguariensis TaxID=185542 RepID=A0ABC8TBL5_9AQUA